MAVVKKNNIISKSRVFPFVLVIPFISYSYILITNICFLKKLFRLKKLSHSYYIFLIKLTIFVCKRLFY